MGSGCIPRSIVGRLTSSGGRMSSGPLLPTRSSLRMFHLCSSESGTLSISLGYLSSIVAINGRAVALAPPQERRRLSRPSKQGGASGVCSDRSLPARPGTGRGERQEQAGDRGVGPAGAGSGSEDHFRCNWAVPSLGGAEVEVGALGRPPEMGNRTSVRDLGWGDGRRADRTGAAGNRIAGARRGRQRPLVELSSGGGRVVPAAVSGRSDQPPGQGVAAHFGRTGHPDRRSDRFG